MNKGWYTKFKPQFIIECFNFQYSIKTELRRYYFVEYYYAGAR